MTGKKRKGEKEIREGKQRRRGMNNRQSTQTTQSTSSDQIAGQPRKCSSRFTTHVKFMWSMAFSAKFTSSYLHRTHGISRRGPSHQRVAPLLHALPLQRPLVSIRKSRLNCSLWTLSDKNRALLMLSGHTVEHREFGNVLWNVEIGAGAKTDKVRHTSWLQQRKQNIKIPMILRLMHGKSIF